MDSPTSWNIQSALMGLGVIKVDMNLGWRCRKGCLGSVEGEVGHGYKKQILSRCVKVSRNKSVFKSLYCRGQKSDRKNVDHLMEPRGVKGWIVSALSCWNRR